MKEAERESSSLHVAKGLNGDETPVMVALVFRSHFSPPKRHMKNFTLLSFALVSLFGASACAMSHRAPVMGTLYSDATAGENVTSNTGASKKGEACAASILGLVGTGDASIATAAREGGITKISYVDGKSTSILGLYATYCTIVAGE